MAVTLLLTRHGETEWHAENRYAGRSDVALTERGHTQATALAAWITTLPADRRPVTVVSSPQSRARHTAAPSADALGVPVDVRADLRELDFGIAEGHTIGELREQHPELVRRFLLDPVAGAFPGGEDPEDAARRGVAALRDISGIAGHHEGPVLVVAHNTLLRVTLCALLGIPVRNYRTVLPRLDNTAITELTFDGTSTALRALNVPTGHT
jgi:probable phosphoglycerate mutase